MLAHRGARRMKGLAMDVEGVAGIARQPRARLEEVAHDVTAILRGMASVPRQAQLAHWTPE